MIEYLKLSLAALLPVFTSIGVYLLNKRTKFGEINFWLKQTLYGVIFGILAIIGTEWGISVNGAQTNCRDAAVVAVGLYFGGPAGIVAGIIGGVERWISVAWNGAYFSRIACSVSTVVAGFAAAFLRIFLFEHKKANWLVAFLCGEVIEVFHISMVFVTNMADPIGAIRVVEACTFPMVIANGASVMLSGVAITLLAGEKLINIKNSQVQISQTIQRWLFLSVIFAFTVTSIFVFNLQNVIADTQSNSLLSMAITETAADIRDASDKNLLALTYEISGDLKNSDINTLAKEHEIAEINVIGADGKIKQSTNPDFVGFDMASGEQSSEFLCLLKDKVEFVQDYAPISYDQSIMRKYAGVKYGDGFVQVGYDAEQFQKDIGEKVIGLTANRHVGSTGYILIINQKMRVVSQPKDMNVVIPVGSAALFDPEYQNNIYTTTINEVEGNCCFALVEGYYIVAFLPMNEIVQLRNIVLYVNSFIEILVYAVLFIMLYMLIRKVVVKQINKINASLAKISSGNLNEVVNVRSNEEFASLSDDINSTVDTLKKYIEEAAARIDKELEFAKNIQKSALPNVFPAFPKRNDFDIYALMHPAKEVGGDFYDFYMTHDDTLNFLIADVSGKGIPAAMFMMRAKTELKSLTEADMHLSEVFTHGNAALCEGNDAGMFVTAWQGNIDLLNGKVTFANAGHNPPLVKHANGSGKFEYLRSRAGFVLAGMDGVKYRTQELDLQPGDIVYLYTDGVTEATNANTELYGEERLLDAINAKEFESMEELCKYVKADVDAFVGEAPQFDDITMVALKYIGKPYTASMSYPNAKLEDIPAITEFVEGELEKAGCPMKVIMQIDIAIDELVSNVVRYAYGDGKGPLMIELQIAKNNIIALSFVDEGKPYNPLKKADPDITLSAEERQIGGLGIFMVKKSMDDMHYEYTNKRNSLTIIKKF